MSPELGTRITIRVNASLSHWRKAKADAWRIVGNFIKMTCCRVTRRKYVWHSWHFKRSPLLPLTTSPASNLPSPISHLPSLVSCLLSLVFHLSSLISCLSSLVSCLPSLVPHLPSLCYCLTSPLFTPPLPSLSLSPWNTNRGWEGWIWP